MIRYTDLLEQLDRGELHGVFIDDTGSPGLANTPKHLHPERKSWVAVLAHRSRMPPLLRRLGGLIWQLRESTGSGEFHFSNLYNGKTPFSILRLQARLQLIHSFVQLFEDADLQVIVQTYDPTQVARAMETWGGDPPHWGPFRSDRHDDAALLVLLWRVKQFIEANDPRGIGGRVFIDEGRFPNGRAVGPLFPPHIADGRVFFANSSNVFPIQLADFAAFVMNRTQLLIGKEKLSKLDRAFLELVSPLAARYRNLTSFYLSSEEWARKGHLQEFASIAASINRGEHQDRQGAAETN